VPEFGSRRALNKASFSPRFVQPPRRNECINSLPLPRVRFGALPFTDTDIDPHLSRVAFGRREGDTRSADRIRVERRTARLAHSEQQKPGSVLTWETTGRPARSK